MFLETEARQLCPLRGHFGVLAITHQTSRGEKLDFQGSLGSVYRPSSLSLGNQGQPLDLSLCSIVTPEIWGSWAAPLMATRFSSGGRGRGCEPIYLGHTPTWVQS